MVNWCGSYQALLFYDKGFADEEDTVVVIDEIQESSTVYNLIREFTRSFHCRFIVTGSYPGRVLNREFKLSAGDLTSIRIETLTFEEFMDALGLDEVYKRLGLYGDSDVKDYAKAESAYEIYCQIGGYPAFATYKGGEIDFYVKSLVGNEKSYAVEVKSGRNQATAGRRALDEGKVDCLLMLKGNTQGGIAGEVYTVPVYLFPKFHFDL